MAEKKPLSFATVGLIMLTLVALFGAGMSVYMYRQWQGTKNLLDNPTEAAKTEVSNLVSRVKKLMMVPDEEPQIATVLEQEKLKDQQFFANAKNGDKVLIFMKAQKAVLYRPSTNVIIEVAPLELTGNATPSGSTQAPAQMSLAIRNGTEKADAVKKVEDMIVGKVQNLTIVEKENAKEKTYKETMVYDVSGTKAAAAAQLAQLVGGKVGTTFPAGEPKPVADFLIIVGADKE